MSDFHTPVSPLGESWTCPLDKLGAGSDLAEGERPDRVPDEPPWASGYSKKHPLRTPCQMTRFSLSLASSSLSRPSREESTSSECWPSSGGGVTLTGWEAILMGQPRAL